MKLREIIKEASTLKALGVLDQTDIKRIHTNLKLSHDAKFEPIGSKKEAMAALKTQSSPVVAVNADGRGVAFGPARDDVYVAIAKDINPSGPTWETLPPSKALSLVTGRGWQWYVGNKGSSKSSYQRHNKYDGEDGSVAFYKKTKMFDSKVKERATAGYKEAREKVLDILDDESSESQRKMVDAKFLLSILKRMSEKGLDGYETPDTLFKHATEKGLDKAIQKFVGATNQSLYAMDKAVKQATDKDPLADKKFIIAIYRTIDSIVDKINKL